jgi:outer membrane protein OmpA-like peptidoglycan-associated protein
VKPLKVCSAVFFLLAFTRSLMAQGGGTLELGLLLQDSYFDRSLGLDQAKGGPGVRVALFPSSRLDIEAEGAFVPTDAPYGHVYYIPLRARVVFNIPSGEHGGFFLGGGYVRSEYRHDADFHDDGATALIGARVGLPGITTIRVASYLDYIPSPSNGVTDNWNWGLQAGLSWLFGGSPRSSSEARQPVPARPLERQDTLALAARRDSLARAATADSIARVQTAVRDSVARAQTAQQQRLRDSVAKVSAQQQALRDSLARAARADSIRTAALRDSLRLTTNRARLALLRDSLSRVALRDTLRYLMSQRQTRVVLQGVNFELGKAVLLPISKDILQDVARSLVANPEVRVEVGGHTDSTGSRALNERLSLARAESVKAYLIENGVAADRMEVHGYASTQPVATNKTKSGRAQNRRVELRRID